MNVEIVIAGALGELAIWALPEVTAERRQVLLMSSSDTLNALSYLTERGLEVVTIRERASHVTHAPSGIGPTRSGCGGEHAARPDSA